MKIWDFSSEDFSNPKSLFDKPFSGLNGDELFILSKEKG